jgi:hypothetical protein
MPRKFTRPSHLGLPNASNSLFYRSEWAARLGSIPMARSTLRQRQATQGYKIGGRFAAVIPVWVVPADGPIGDLRLRRESLDLRGCEAVHDALTIRLRNAESRGVRTFPIVHLERHPSTPIGFHGSDNTARGERPVIGEDFGPVTARV